MKMIFSKFNLFLGVLILTKIFMVQTGICQTGQIIEETVTDFDGNVYQTVTIGDQIWLKENLKSLHYADGTIIPDVAAYNNSDSLANIYGRLYTWYAAMRDSNSTLVRGVCPCGYHMPTDAEWIEMENYLGGAAVAGGKMKSMSNHWNAPNSGATNSSGFSALPAGEYDPYNATKFRLINEYAVYWTATSVNASKARERYLAYNKSNSTTFDWYKTLKYSIRCVKKIPVSSIQRLEENGKIPNIFQLGQNYPNPFNPLTTIPFYLEQDSEVSLELYDLNGKKVANLFSGFKHAGAHKTKFNANYLPSGIYTYRITVGNKTEIKRMILLK